MGCATGPEDQACDRQQTSQAAHCHHIVRPCAEDAELREAVSPLKLPLSHPMSNAPAQETSESCTLPHGFSASQLLAAWFYDVHYEQGRVCKTDMGCKQ